MQTSSPTQIHSTCTANVVQSQRSDTDTASIAVLLSGSLVRSSKSSFVSALLESANVQPLTAIVATLFQTLPNLKLAVPLDGVSYSPPDKDVGITELPITW